MIGENPADQPEQEKEPGTETPKIEKLIDTDSPVHEAPSPQTSIKGASGGSSTPGEVAGFDATPLTSSVTTGSAHTLEGTQTYNNQAFDKTSVSATDVSTCTYCYSNVMALISI